MHRAPSYYLRAASLASPTALLVLANVFALGSAVGSQTATAQISTLTAQPETRSATEPEAEKPSLAELQADVKERLDRAESRLRQAKEAETAPSAALLEKIEKLNRINFVLAQIERGREENEKIEKRRIDVEQALEQLNESVPGEDEPFSVRQLDDVQDELSDAQRRLRRLTENEESAVSDLEKAEQEFRRKDSARRLALESSAENTDDARRGSLREAASRASLASELADAALDFRKQELANAKAEIEVQDLKVKILNEKEARLQARANFTLTELREIQAEIQWQRTKLEQAALAAERAYETEQPIFNQLQFEVNRSTEGSNQLLNEKFLASQMNKYLQEDQQKLLINQLGRLTNQATAWDRRHELSQQRPRGPTLFEWIEDADAVLSDTTSQLKDNAVASEELSRARRDLKAVKDKRSDLPKNSPLEPIVDRQLKLLEQRLEAFEQEIASLTNTQSLVRKLKAELTGDTLANKAKDQLLGLWSTIGSLWNFELTSFGDKSVTVQKVVTALLILMAGFVFSRALSRALGRQVLRRLDIDPSASATIQSLFYYTLLLMFSLIALNIAKVPLTAFTVLGGAVALGIGFGSQNIINNFISGLILLAERPVKVGDLIQLDQANGEQLYGNIEHIGARSTRVRTGSNLEIIVPNSSFLQNNVVNFTLSSDKVRTKVEVGVIYGSPTVTVTQLLRRAVIETGRVAKDPPPIILFKNFADSALLFEVHFWLRMRTMMDQMQIESAVRFRIDQLFREEGITIAFPQRDVHLDTSQPLAIQMLEAETRSAS
ncbi:MAG: mechanosensitive ion channel domain-containing protein [Planctomycetota bacterium]